MDAWKGLVATGEYSQGMDFLEGVRTAADILPVALALEEGARIFYGAAADLFDDPEAKATFTALVRAEENHRRKLVEACAVMMPDTRCEIPSGEEGLRGFMEGAVRIDEALEWARREKRRPLEILELAVQMEANSLDFYLKVAAREEFAPIGTVLEELIEDEKGHLRRLADLLERNV